MSYRIDETHLEGYYPSFDSKRVHSFNSYLTDKSYNSTSGLQGIKRLMKFGSKIFGPRKKEFDLEINSKDEQTWGSDDNGDLICYPSEYATQRKPSHSKTKPIDNEPINASEPTKVVSQHDLKKRRIIVVSGFPRNTSLNGFLYRVCGGPLERVVYQANRLYPTIELYFMFPRDAMKFWEYGLTGLLLHNGKHVRMEWANETNTDNISLIHPLVDLHLRLHLDVGARRTLAFVKEKQKTNGLAENHSSDLNIKNILLDFAVIGNIVEFCPIVARALAFGLHFDDVRSAISAKQQCETPGTKLNDKYKDWKITFVRDITERPCFVV